MTQTNIRENFFAGPEASLNILYRSNRMLITQPHQEDQIDIIGMVVGTDNGDQHTFGHHLDYVGSINVLTQKPVEHDNAVELATAIFKHVLFENDQQTVPHKRLTAENEVLAGLALRALGKTKSQPA